MENPEVSAQTGPKTGQWIAPYSLISIVFAFFGAQIVGGIVLYRYGFLQGWGQQQVTDWLTNSIAAQFAFLVISEGLTLLAIYGLLRSLHWTWRTIGLTRPRLKQIGAGLIAVVPYYALYLLILGVVSHFVPSLNVDQKQEVGFDNVSGTAQLIMTFISLVVLPPIVEEIATRGFLYTGLRQWLPKVASALLVSAVFGAAHLGEGGAAGPLWVGAIDTFTLSLVLVYLRERTGSLWAGITLHTLKNGIAFVLLFVVGTS